MEFYSGTPEEERMGWKVRVWKNYVSEDYGQLTSAGRVLLPYWSLEKAREIRAEHDDADCVEIYRAIMVCDLASSPLPGEWKLKVGEVWEKLEDETWYPEKGGNGHKKGIRATTPVGNPYLYTVEELRKMCKERGFDHRGNKIDLIRRLFGKSYSGESRQA